MIFCGANNDIVVHIKKLKLSIFDIHYVKLIFKFLSTMINQLIFYYLVKIYNDGANIVHAAKGNQENDTKIKLFCNILINKNIFLIFFNVNLLFCA